MNVLCYIFVLLSVSVGFSVQDDLKVSVYYEALCPDSMNFIVKQFYPTWVKLQSIFEVDLIPYGKAIQNKVDGKWEFECQHGPSECYGNKIQTCALKQDIELSKKMAYVNCLMGTYDPSTNGKQCAASTGIEWEPIRACSSSQIGDDYLAEMGDLTHAVEPQISFVPTIIFNDTYNGKNQWDSLKNFKKVVCREQQNPKECS